MKKRAGINQNEQQHNRPTQEETKGVPAQCRQLNCGACESFNWIKIELNTDLDVAFRLEMTFSQQRISNQNATDIWY